MNIKLATALLTLSAALHASAFAQSATVTFNGRISSPVCSGIPLTAPSWTHLSNAPPMDTTGCEDSTEALIASARLSQHDAPSLPASFAVSEQGDDAEPVWTITYH